MANDPVEETVQVVYAKPDVQRVVTLVWRPNLTAGEAVSLSGLLEQFPEIGRQPLLLGLFGAAIVPERTLEPGDRVEILRPLVRDPRELRRELLRHGQVMGGGGAKREQR